MDWMRHHDRYDDGAIVVQKHPKRPPAKHNAKEEIMMKSTSNISGLVRRCFSAYELKDRKMIEELLSEDFTFSSPLDDHISRTEYFKRCWPNSEKTRAFRIEQLFEKGNEVFVRYECKQMSGAKFRNTEFFTFEGNKIKAVDVFFGQEMATGSSKSADENHIRALLDDRAKAVRAKDTNGAVSSSALDILSFDVVNPLQYAGSDALKKRLEDWFSAFQGLIGYEICDLNITAGDDVAFSHSLNRVIGTKTDGKKIEMYWRATIATARLTASGWSRMSTIQCLSTRRTAERRLI